MDNDLFTATETLNNAFREVLKQSKPKSKWGMRGQFKRLKEAIEQRNLTISEKLLLCYDINSKDLFASRDVNAKNKEVLRKNLATINKEEKRIKEIFYKLPKGEQKRISKELGLDKMSSVVYKEDFKNHNSTPFEHIDKKDSKNGKQ